MSFSILNSFNLLRTLSSKVFQISSSSMHTLSNSTALTRNTLSGGNSLCLIPVRTNIRCHFPRPNERMRIKKHGYKKRLSTQAGLRVLLRRVLKGRHVLSH